MLRDGCQRGKLVRIIQTDLNFETLIGSEKSSMPIYEYECRKCKAHVEILQKITDAPLTKCRKCGGKLEKQWSAAGFQFKGTGWYVTDYAGKKRDGAEEKKGSAADASTNASSASSTDKAAPATTTEKAAPSKSASGKKAATSKNSTGD